VNSAPELGTLAGGKLQRAQAGYLSRVEIETTDGKVVHGVAAPAPGHPKNPFTDADLADKVRENAQAFAGAEQTKKLVQLLFSVEKMKNVRELTSLLALTNTAIDAVCAS
jgi:2-methylcitrate dehydratase